MPTRFFVRESALTDLVVVQGEALRAGFHGVHFRLWHGEDFID